MLDEKDLQAIAKLMDVKLTRQKQEIMHEVGALIEADVLPKFNLLADGQKLIREQMVTRDDLADLESRLDVLEAVTRRNVREIDKLKKAQ